MKTTKTNNTLNKNFNLVWYGTCEEECSELSLNEYIDDLDFVFQISEETGGWKCWSSDMANVESINDFDKLICGNIYAIKLKKDVDSLQLPNIVVSKYADDVTLHTSPNRVSNDCCEIIPTPTPQISKLTPTPTQTPSTSPTECFKMIFDSTGDDQVFIVPSGITKLTAEIWGAGGSDGCYKNAGGSGGYAQAVFNVTPGEKLIIGVGQTSIGKTDSTFGIPGYSPGGTAGKSGDSSSKCGGSGGGMSGIFRNNISVENAIAIAGGGGGAGGDWTELGAGGGAGGGKFGTGGFRFAESIIPDGGRPGTHLSGGFGNPSDVSEEVRGSQFNGGNGKVNATSSGGGGGAGFFGGGAGAALPSEDSCGGGGSGYLNEILTISGKLITGARGMATIDKDVGPILPHETKNRGNKGQNNSDGRVVLYTHDTCEPIYITPTPENIYPTPTPTPDKPTITPTPTPEKIVPTPTPTPDKPTITPTPTPEKIVPTPTPTPEKIVPTPTPTPEKIVPTPTPTPDKPTITPTPTPEKIVPTPTPTPEVEDCCENLGHLNPTVYETTGDMDGDKTEEEGGNKYDEFGNRIKGLELGGKLCYDYGESSQDSFGWSFWINPQMALTGQYNIQLQGAAAENKTQKTGTFYSAGMYPPWRNEVVYTDPNGICFVGKLTETEGWNVLVQK